MFLPAFSTLIARNIWKFVKPSALLTAISNIGDLVLGKIKDAYLVTESGCKPSQGFGASGLQFALPTTNIKPNCKVVAGNNVAAGATAVSGATDNKNIFKYRVIGIAANLMLIAGSLNSSKVGVRNIDFVEVTEGIYLFKEDPAVFGSLGVSHTGEPYIAFVGWFDTPRLRASQNLMKACATTPSLYINTNLAALDAEDGGPMGCFTGAELLACGITGNINGKAEMQWEEGDYTIGVVDGGLVKSPKNATINLDESAVVSSVIIYETPNGLSWLPYSKAMYGESDPIPTRAFNAALGSNETAVQIEADSRIVPKPFLRVVTPMDIPVKKNEAKELSVYLLYTQQADTELQPIFHPLDIFELPISGIQYCKTNVDTDGCAYILSDGCDTIYGNRPKCGTYLAGVMGVRSGQTLCDGVILFYETFRPKLIKAGGCAAIRLTQNEEQETYTV